MAYALQRIGRVRVKDEAAGTATFAVEQSSAIASFKDVRYTACEITLDQEMVADDAVVQRAFQSRLRIVGQKRCTMRLDVDLCGTGTPYGNDVLGDTGVYTDSALNLILKTVLGGYNTYGGSAEAAGSASTATAVTVTTGDGSHFVGGGAMATVINGRLEAREVDTSAANVLTPKVALSAAPTDLAVVYNGHTTYLDETAATSLAFVVETADRDNVYWLLGMQCTGMSITTTLGQVAKLSFTFEGANWLQDDSVGTPIGGAAIAAATYTDAAPPVYVNNQCFFAVGGSEPYAYAASLIHPSSVEVTFGLKWQAVPSPSGVNGIVGWVLVPETPMVSVAITLPVDAGNIKTYQAAQLAQTICGFWQQIGNVAGNTVIISAPSLQIVNVQQAESAPSLRGVRIETVGIEDQDQTPTTALLRSPLRFHRL